MAIATGDAIFKYGTQTKVTHVTSTGSLATATKSGDSDAVEWTNTDDAAFGTFILNVQFATQPTARTAVQLYARMTDVEGTNDVDALDANYDGTYVGTFLVNDGTAAQYLPLVDAPIPSAKSAQTMKFHVLNQAGQTMSAGWQLWITDKTWGAKA